MWFQALHLSFPLSSLLTLQAGRGFTLVDNHFLAHFEVMHPVNECWLPSRAKLLEHPGLHHQDTPQLLAKFLAGVGPQSICI